MIILDLTPEEQVPSCEGMVREWVLTHRMMLLPAPQAELYWITIQFSSLLPPSQTVLQAVHLPPQPWGSKKSSRAPGSWDKEGELQRFHKGELTWYLLLFPGSVLFHLLESQSNCVLRRWQGQGDQGITNKYSINKSIRGIKTFDRDTLIKNIIIQIVDIYLKWCNYSF